MLGVSSGGTVCVEVTTSVIILGLSVNHFGYLVVKFVLTKSNHINNTSKMKFELICRVICDIYNA
jgi:hypothetical protein